MYTSLYVTKSSVYASMNNINVTSQVPHNTRPPVPKGHDNATFCYLPDNEVTGF